MTDAIARQGVGQALAVMPAEMTIEELVARARKVQEAMKAVMHEGEHYGVIPGTGTKPTLLKPGAEKLLNLFMLDPEYDAPPLYEGDHLTIVSRCTLYHIPTGTRVGSGMGMCSTREAKYAYRQGKRVCPKCGADAINKSKYPPRGKPNDPPGWYCFAKAGGCGQEFAAEDQAVIGQVVGRIDNPDKADQYNTVLKMANKRSLIAAVLNVTGASDIFTQDLEDLVPAERVQPVVEAPAAAPAPVRETIDAEAQRLFPDAAPGASGEELVKRIGDRIDMLSAKETPESKGRAMKNAVKIWHESCGAAKFLDPAVDPVALTDVLLRLGGKI